MRFLTTIIVLVIAAAGVFAMLRTGWVQSERRWEASSVRKLLDAEQLPIDEITRVVVTRRDQAPMVFERGAGQDQWNQTQPFAYPLDAYAIRKLAMLARELEVLDTVNLSHAEGALSGESLSLNPPAVQIQFDWPNGSTTLKLGRRSVAARAYLQINNDPMVYLVDQRLHERAVDMDAKEWRSRRIFTENAGADAQRIEWINGQFRMAMMRERRQWFMEAPARTRLDQQAREQYLGALGQAVVSGFVLDSPSEADLSRFGLKGSTVTLAIHNSSGTQRLTLGSRAGGGTQDFFAIVEGRPVIVRVSGAVVAHLFMQAQTLASHTASGINPADVKAIVVRNQTEEFRLERELEKWSLQVAGPEARTVNPALPRELLEQLTQLRASTVEFAEYPRDKERAIITLFGYDGRAIDTVRVVHDAASGHWAMENGDNVLRVYPPSLNLKIASADYAE